VNCSNAFWKSSNAKLTGLRPAIHCVCRDSNFQFVGNTSTEAPPVDGVAHALLWRLEMERVLSSYDADNFRVLLQVRLEKRLSQFWTL
jgi:hypothetical protein